MNGRDTGWFLHTGRETKRWTDRRTETDSGQAVVKGKKGKDRDIFVVFAAGDVFCHRCGY